MAYCTCALATSWCPRADELFGVEGLHVLEVSTGEDGLLVCDVESDQTLTGCPQCGVVAVGHGRRVQVLHDAPCFGRPVLVRWFKRIWRCPESACGRRTWTEGHDLAPPGRSSTARAIDWAVDALRHDDTHGLCHRPSLGGGLGHLLERCRSRGQR
jgi:transposase